MVSTRRRRIRWSGASLMEIGVNYQQGYYLTNSELNIALAETI